MDERAPVADAQAHVGAELRARSPERWLSCLWAAEAARPALLAVHALDCELQRIVAEIGDPLLAEIRLAWWREQLLALAAGAAPPAQPLLRLLAAVGRRRVDLERLARIEEAFLPLATAGGFDARAHARLRGALLFEALFEAAGGSGGPGRAAAPAAGEMWAQAALWRERWGRVAARIETARAQLAPAAAGAATGAQLPVPLRVLAGLARADLAAVAAGRRLAPAATAGRQLRMALVALAPRRA